MNISIYDLCDKCRTNERAVEQINLANRGSFSRASKELYERAAEKLRKSGCTTCPGKLERATVRY